MVFKFCLGKTIIMYSDDSGEENATGAPMMVEVQNHRQSSHRSCHRDSDDEEYEDDRFVLKT